MTVLPFPRQRGAPAGLRPALLAVAHGSRDPRHAAALRGLTAAVAAARPGLRVEPAFLGHGAPDVPTALGRLAREGVGAVQVVPMLLGRGYHVRHDLPAILDAVRARYRAAAAPPPRITLAEALGPDPLLLDALDRRLREAGLWPSDPDLRLVLASAGSGVPAARAGIERAAASWSAGGPVLCAYASAAAPDTAHALAALRARGHRQLAVASYFLAPGTLPDRVAAQARDCGAPVTATLTTPDAEPPAELVELVLRRYAAACGGAAEDAAA